MNLRMVHVDVQNTRILNAFQDDVTSFRKQGLVMMTVKTYTSKHLTNSMTLEAQDLTWRHRQKVRDTPVEISARLTRGEGGGVQQLRMFVLRKF